MKKIYRGKFYDSAPISYIDDWMDQPIGAHGAAIRRDRDVAKSVCKRYYYVDEKGCTHIISKPRLFQKIFAIRTRSVHYVDQCTIDEKSK